MMLLEDGTQVFIVRIWLETRDITDAPVQWRGVVEHVPTGERRYFTDLRDIKAFVGHRQIELQAGEGVVLYTDGITEAFDKELQPYGIERLCEAIGGSWQSSVEEVRRAVIEDVRRHVGEAEVYDDITLLICRRRI